MEAVEPQRPKRLSRHRSSPAPSSSNSSEKTTKDSLVDLTHVDSFTWKNPSTINRPVLSRTQTYPISTEADNEINQNDKIRANITNKDTVTLNVGGIIHITSSLTLSLPEESNLNHLFRVSNNTDKKGRIFIDRDGDLFTYILGYLRSGALNVSSDFTELKKLRNEAKFFNLKGLCEKVDEKLNEKLNDEDFMFHSYNVTLTQHSTYNIRKRDHVEIAFKRTCLITVAGHVAACREIFGFSLSMDRDTNVEKDRYSCRMYLTHTNITSALDRLINHGFTLITSNEYNATDKNMDAVSKNWIHVTNFHFATEMKKENEKDS